jgi:hypothetical protein
MQLQHYAVEDKPARVNKDVEKSFTKNGFKWKNV